jgi:crotonyl-CoA reductase
MSELDLIRQAVDARAAEPDFLALKVPESFRGATLRRSEERMFSDEARGAVKDLRKSIHVDEVATPDVGPGEALVAVMASAINFNTVWSATFEPVSTFGFLDRLARSGEGWTKHSLPVHVIGSDAAGVVVRVGPGSSRWRAGDRVIVQGVVNDPEEPAGHADGMLDPRAMVWGYETNFGGLAELCLVKTTQLLPKAEHLTWEEAACNHASSGCAYRELVSQNGAGMKQGQIVLIWGAAGGIGSYAVQYALNGGAYPVAVVSNPARAKLVREMGCEWVIDRTAEGFRFWDGDRIDSHGLRGLRDCIRSLTGGDDPDIVFEHPGRDTFAASVFVAKRGGVVCTCASSSGFLHTYDNRYLWMNLKKIIGTHCANYQESAEANRLLMRGAIYPTLSRTYALSDVAEAAEQVQLNACDGKVGVLCLAEREGLGVLDAALRERHRGRIELYRRHAAEARSPVEARTE